MSDPKSNKYLEYLSLGGEIAILLSVPILTGFWIDQRFETSPWGLILGLILGITLMGWMFWRLFKSISKSD